MHRPFAVLLPLVVLCSAVPTRADTSAAATIATPAAMSAPAMASPLDRADRALYRTMPLFFDKGTMRERELPAFGTARHQVTLGELNFEALPRFDVHCGAGLAHIVDAPADSRLPTTGFAAVAGASFVLYQPAGFRLGVDLSALHIGYGAAGVNDATILFALKMH